MTEMQQALAVISSFRTATAIQYPSGRWGLVGKVPIDLLYTMADGSPLTEKMIEGIRHCGAGLYRKRIRSVTFASKEEAEIAAR